MSITTSDRLPESALQYYPSESTLSLNDVAAKVDIATARYSSNQDISRARQAFFQGKKSFLLVSERFHFYKRFVDLDSACVSACITYFSRRYKIRGIRNLLFYGPPDHSQYYTEMLSYPFLDDGVDVSDVTCRVLYSKYDWFKLERIAGTDGAVELIKSN